MCAACAVLALGCGRDGRFACRFPRGAQRAGGEEPMKRTQDIKAQYQPQMDEEGILLAAANILEQRLHRQGRIHSPRASWRLPHCPLRSPAARSLWGRLPGHQAPYPGNRTSLLRHHRRLRYSFPSSRQARSGIERSCRHPFPQSPKRQSGAKRSRPQGHRAPAAGSGPPRHPGAGPPGDRRASAHQPCSKRVGVALPLAARLLA